MSPSAGPADAMTTSASSNSPVEKLPEELRLRVVKSFQQYSVQLRMLCLVRPFHAAATEYLYARPTINDYNYTLLLRTVVQQPQLSELIRELLINTRSNLREYNPRYSANKSGDLDLFRKSVQDMNLSKTVTEWICNHIEEEATIRTLLLMSTPNIRDLTCWLQYDDYYQDIVKTPCWVFPPRHIGNGGMDSSRYFQSLERLSVNMMDIGFDCILPAFRLLALEVLHIWCADSALDTCLVDTIYTTSIGFRSNISTLILEYCSLDPELICMMVQRCESLRNLSIIDPDLPKLGTRSYTRLCETLGQSCPLLEELEIFYNNYNERSSTIEPSKSGLTSTNIEELKIEAGLLLDEDNLPDSLSDILPGTIRVLRVCIGHKSMMQKLLKTSGLLDSLITGGCHRALPSLELITAGCLGPLCRRCWRWR